MRLFDRILNMQSRHPPPFCVGINRRKKVSKKFVGGLCFLSYEVALQRLGLFFLIGGRVRGDLICMFKITHFPFDAVFAAPTRSGLRGHDFKIPLQRRKTCHHQHVFNVRVVPYWNKLPEEIVNTSSMQKIKSRHDLSNSSPELVPSYRITP